MTNLSVIIVSYNTAPLTLQCVESLVYALMASLLKWEVIIVDNASTDDTIAQLNSYASTNKVPLKIIPNSQNVGFGAANNIGAAQAVGEYILLLNSDTIVDNLHFDELIEIADSHRNLGVLSVKLNLPDGSMDPACHRGFPTPWRSFSYLSGLEKLTKDTPYLNTIFGGYHLTSLPLDQMHEIETPSGAFFLMKRVVFQGVGGFDEQFFMYAEDIDLALRVHKKGYRNWFCPRHSIVHLKGQSGMQNAQDQQKKQQTNVQFYQAMLLFYDKHYEDEYPTPITWLVHTVLERKIASLSNPTSV